MMPLTLANTGEELMIRKVGGSPEVRQHLETLGFVAGGTAPLSAFLCVPSLLPYFWLQFRTHSPGLLLCAKPYSFLLFSLT